MSAIDARRGDGRLSRPSDSAPKNGSAAFAQIAVAATDREVDRLPTRVLGGQNERGEHWRDRRDPERGGDRRRVSPERRRSSRLIGCRSCRRCGGSPRCPQKPMLNNVKRRIAGKRDRGPQRDLRARERHAIAGVDPHSGDPLFGSKAERDGEARDAADQHQERDQNGSRSRHRRHSAQMRGDIVQELENARLPAVPLLERQWLHARSCCIRPCSDRPDMSWHHPERTLPCRGRATCRSRHSWA